jgi:hypothetical protein
LLGLWSVVLSAVLLLLLVYRVSESIEPGMGLATATLGLSTLILPFSTVVFSHVVAATLGFAAFSLLHWERFRSPRLVLVGGAGLLAGLAATTEFPLALVAVLLGLYAAARPRALLRFGAYAFAGVVGLIPLFAYNWWAFGSPAHLAYANVIGGLNRSGLVGVHARRSSVLMQLLLAKTALLQMAPILVMAAALVVMLYRHGDRAEALLITAVCAAYLLYDSAYWDPFGGASPGPAVPHSASALPCPWLGPLLPTRPAHHRLARARLICHAGRSHLDQPVPRTRRRLV